MKKIRFSVKVTHQQVKLINKTKKTHFYILYQSPIKGTGYWNFKVDYTDFGNPGSCKVSRIS